MIGFQLPSPIEIETPFGQGLAHAIIYPTEGEALWQVFLHDGGQSVFVPNPEIRGVRNWSHQRRRVDYPKRKTPPWVRQADPAMEPKPKKDKKKDKTDG